jgi:hypothetical protein
VLQNPRTFVKFLYDFKSQHYPYSLPFFQKYHNHLIYFASFHHLLRLIILLLLRKVMGTSFLQIQIENYVRKIEPQMIQIRPLKRRRRKEVKEYPNSIANWRFQCLVAFERFHSLVALERYQRLVANGRFQCLVANARRRKSTFSPLPPNKFYLNLHFFQWF